MAEQQPEQPPLYDPGNLFVQNTYPTMVGFGHVDTDRGPFLVVTIRSGPATLTLHLDRDAALDAGKRWMLAAEKLPIIDVGRDGLVVPHRRDGNGLIVP